MEDTVVNVQSNIFFPADQSRNNNLSINGNAGSGSGGGGLGGGNINNSNNNESSSSVITNQRATYTIPGILHYLQHEWTRFEYDRQQWEADRAELMSKISFLQGERRGQENLKNDLVRRIKMLELALKQERIKYYKLKYGVEPKTQDDLKTQTQQQQNEQKQQDDNNQNEFDLNYSNILNSNQQINNIKNGRQLLRQYLQEIGYADTIIDIRSSRLRTLLNSGGGGNGNGKVSLTSKQFNEHQMNKTHLINGDLNASTESVRKLLLANSSNLNNSNSSDQLSIQQQQQQQLQQQQRNRQSPKQQLIIKDHVQINFGNLDGPKNSLSPSKTTNTDGQIENNSNDLDVDDEGGEQDVDEDEDEDEDDDEDDLQEENEINQTVINRVYKKNGSSPPNDTLTRDAGGDGDDDDGSQATSVSDSDTEDALKEFSFLNSELSGSGSSGSGSSSSLNDEWKMDKEALQKLTDNYKKDRKKFKQNESIQNIHRPTRATLQAMINNLTDDSMDIDGGGGSGSDGGSGGGKTMDEEDNETQNSLKKMGFLENDGMESTVNLGELSRISVTNNDDTIMDNSFNNETLLSNPNKKHTLTNRFTLRGHFDSVRCLAFHPSNGVLVSGSEDQTMKLWNLEGNSSKSGSSSGGGAKKATANNDVESYYTYRGHNGAVLSVLFTADGQNLLTSSVDGTVKLWSLPPCEDTDPYNAYDSNIFQRTLASHTDSVWQLILHENLLISSSADGTIRIWNPFTSDEANASLLTKSNVFYDKSVHNEGIPTSINFLSNDTTKLLCSFDSLQHILYDIEYCKQITTFDYTVSDKSSSYCYKLISNPMNTQIISAHEDKRIRIYDINSAKLTFSMVAHQDAVTDLALDPNQSNLLLSSSHDCSLRLWNLDNKNCIQEITAHRKKYDESIHCLNYHLTQPYVASGAADAIVKVYV